MTKALSVQTYDERSDHIQFLRRGAIENNHIIKFLEMWGKRTNRNFLQEFLENLKKSCSISNQEQFSQDIPGITCIKWHHSKQSPSMPITPNIFWA